MEFALYKLIIIIINISILSFRFVCDDNLLSIKMSLAKGKKKK